MLESPTKLINHIMKMKKLFCLLFIVFVGIAAYAQIPAEVETVLKKCSEKMNNSAGVEMDLNLSVKAMAVFSLNGTIKMYAKGDKSLAKVKMKVLGREIRSETGSNGKEQWFLKPAVGNGKDTIIITTDLGKKKGEFDIDFDLYNEYTKAKMKEKNGRYEITLTNPKDKDMPKKTIMVVNKSDYTFHEMTIKDGANGFTVTATKIKFGVNDAILTFDPKKYPNAVVVRRDIGHK